MIRCPKCEQKLNPIRLGYLGDSNCPKCYVQLEPRNKKLLTLISVFLGSISVGFIKMFVSLTWFWRFTLILWMWILIYILLSAFFLRVCIKIPRDKPLNLT
jgi:hypothetical protein